MAIKCSAETTITNQIDATDLIMWYYATTLTTKPLSPSTTAASATPTGWSLIEPTITSASDLSKYIYECLQIVWGDGTCSWGDVQLSASFEAAKQAYNLAHSTASIFTTFEQTHNKTLVDTVNESSSAITTLTESHQYGGINLLSNTKSIDSSSAPYTNSNISLYSNQAPIDGESFYYCSGPKYFQIDFPTLINNQKYTLSFDISRSSNSQPVFVKIDGIETNIGTAATTWTRLSHTFIASASTTNAQIRVAFDSTSSTATYIAAIRHIKLEQGSLATPWEYSSNDISTLSNTVNTVSQTANSNSSTISNLTQTLGTNANGTTKTDDIVHQVSNINQDLNGITTRVGKTEIALKGNYAVSSTAKGTANKQATISPTLANYELVQGAAITVKFTTENTAANPTLNINSTGAKPIKTYSGAALSESEYKWDAGSTMTFVYDGTNWCIQDSTELTRIKSSETLINQTANNVLIKATESDTTAAQGGQHLIQSLINVAPNGIKISADKVDIEGAAIFSENGYLSQDNINAINNESQTIYIQAVSGTSSVLGTTTWVTNTGESVTQDAANLTPVWTIKRPIYRTNYPVLFVATQYKTIDGTVTCTTPLKDDTITVIDAGHITTGTIDASNITVTNLNADNITTGTINGQRIGVGSLSLDKLAEDVYTETEVNNIVDNLQTQIDGAIETWTGTSVPTLNNTPASAWTTDPIKDTHVGDVYFVVNDQSQQNGYNYRFTKTTSNGTSTYSWQLIKDNDVTNALQRLTTAEGKIGNIETFDSTVSSYMTNTDNELSSIKSAATTLAGRVDTAEGTLATKVDTSTFNTLSQTVGENTSSISNLTETVTTTTQRLNNLRAGSTNLLVLSTSQDQRYATSNGKTLVTNSSANGSSNHSTWIDVEGGADYCLSWYYAPILPSGYNQYLYALFYDDDTTYLGFAPNPVSNISGIDSGTYHMIAPENATKAIICFPKTFLNRESTGFTGYGLKFEKGSIPTDFSLAPYDAEIHPNILRGTNQPDTLSTVFGQGSGGWRKGEWGEGSGTQSNGSVTIVEIDDPPSPEQKYAFQIYSSTTGNKDATQYGGLPFPELCTLSFWTRVPEESSTDNPVAQVRVWGTSAIKTYTSTLSKETGWIYHNVTWIFTEAQLALNPGLLVGIKGKGIIEYCGLKLEKGYISTPWIPAHEDYAGAHYLENLQIGGRNLLLNTAMPFTLSTPYSNLPYSLSNEFNNFTTYDDITLSFWATTETDCWVDFYWQNNSTSYNNANNFWPAIQLIAGKKYYTVTGQTGLNIANALYLRVRQSDTEHGASVKISDITFADVKLERGTRASTWSPAPEDVETAITTVSNTVNTVSQTVDSNSAKITNLTTVLGTNADGTTSSTDIIHRTSAIEQDLSGFKTTVSETYSTKTETSQIESRVSTAESTIDQHSTSIALKANSSDVYTKNETNGLISTEVSNRNSAIEQSASQIQLSVSETYSTKEELSDSIKQIDTDSGVVIHVGGPINSLSVDGNSTQDGTPTPEAPVAIKSVDDLSLVMCGKNLLDTSEWYEGKYINASGTVTNSGDAHYTPNYSSILEGTYTFTMQRLSDSGNVVRLHGYDENRQWVRQIYTVTLNAGTTDYSYTVTIDSDIKYLRVSSSVGASQYQLELGSTATAYEPYIGVTAPIDLQDHELRSLPDGTQDQLNLTYDRPSKRAGWAWYKASIEVGTLKLTKDSGFSQFQQVGSTSHNRVRFAVANSMGAVSHSMCNSFVYNSSTYNYGTPGDYYISGGYAYFVIPDSITSLTDANAWLAENPITLVYTNANGSTTIQLEDIELPIITEDMNVWVTASLLTNISAEWYTNMGLGVFSKLNTDALNSRITAAESSITQNANNIELKVSKDSVISSINQSAEEIKIQASKVNIDGTAIFTNSDFQTQLNNQGYATTTQVATAKSEAISAAASDATSKANAAQSAAISTAAADATSKANAAEANAKSDAAAALAVAQDAQTTANSKRRIFTTTPTVPYDVGDLWVDGTSIKYANTSKTDSQTYSESDWAVTATDDSLAQTALNAAGVVQDNLNSARTWYAECDDAAATVAKVATITPVTEDFVLTVGSVVYIKFAVTNSAAVASITLNVNNTGAKRIQYTASGGNVANLPAVGYLIADRVYQFIYDGTYWVLQYNYNSNTTYNLGQNLYYNTLKAKSAIAAETIIVGDANGYAQAQAGITFDLSYPILWCTKAIAADKTNYANIYTSIQDRNLKTHYSSFQGTVRAMVYLVGTVSGNTITLDSSMLTSTEPTTENGKIYIPIGRHGNQYDYTSAPAYFFFDCQTTTLFAYLDGEFRQVTPTEIVSTHRIYYRTATANSSLAAPTTWVEEATGNVYNQWTTKVPPLAASTASGQTKYLYLYTCEQRKRLDGTTVCTKVLLDENTTVIDGGSIITNSITANQIAAGTITADKLNATNINASNSLTIGALDSNTQDAILNSNISVGGRNLVYNNSLSTISGYSNSSNISYLTYISVANYLANLEDGDPIVISFDAKADSNITAAEIYAYQESGHSIANNGTSHWKIDLTTEWQHYVIRTTVKDWTGTYNAGSIMFLYKSNNNTIRYLRKLKIESGTIATDWTPAPEDIDTDISEAAKTATNYITADPTGGIKIHMSANSTTYQHLSATANTYYVNGNKRTEVNANGLEVFDGTYGSEESVAAFGTVARLGKATGNKVIADSTGVHIYNVQDTVQGPQVTQVAEFGQAPGELTTTMLSDEPAIGINYTIPVEAINDDNMSIVLDDRTLAEDTDYTLSSGIVTLLESATVTDILDDSSSGGEESSEDVETHSLICKYMASAGVGLAIGASVTRPGLDVAERAIFRHPSFVEASHSTANADTGFRAVRNDTGIQVFCGIGIGGINHGVYSQTLKRWLINADSSAVHVAPHTVTDGNINIKSKWVYATTPSASKGNGWGHGLQYLDTAGDLVGVAKAYSLTTGEKGIQLSATRKIGSTTVNNGIMLGVDASGNRKLNFNGGGRTLWRQALGFEAGHVNTSYGGTDNAPKNAYRDIPITFGYTHTYTPHVVATFSTGSTGVTMGGLSLSVLDITTTGCKVRIYNNTNDTRNPALEWVAID